MALVCHCASRRWEHPDGDGSLGVRGDDLGDLVERGLGELMLYVDMRLQWLSPVPI